MRSYLGLFCVAMLLAASGCVVKDPDSSGGTGGGGGSGGSGGGAPAGPCGAVPTTGECVDATKIRSCFVSETAGEDPKILEVDCLAVESCQIVNGSAACVLTGDCYDGQSTCKNATTVQNCVSNAWVDQDCGTDQCLTQPGQGALCGSSAAGSGIFLRGHLDYEFRRPRTDLVDFESTVSQEAAVDFFVTVYDNNELIGLGLTSPGGGGKNPGDWELELDRNPTDQSFIYFWPMLFDSNGTPRMAIAHAQSTDPIHQSSTEYWVWGFPGPCTAPGECTETETGSQLIKEADGSGAAHIYQWLDYGIFRLADLLPGIEPLTYAVFWEPGNDFTCGNCFVPPIGGGSDVIYDEANNLSDHFQTAMNISGSSSSPTHWAKSVINHELGHWVTSSYSKSPGEGGQHFVDAASLPGLAFSEGWATFNGQTEISTSPSDPDPIYFTKQQGTVFWVNINSNVWSGGALELPDPSGPIDQNINENVVASMLWSLWASGNAQNPQALGDAPLFKTLTAQRLVGDVNRGYFKVDLVDYLDAMKCEGNATAGQISAVVGPIGYPYDNAEICQ